MERVAGQLGLGAGKGAGPGTQRQNCNLEEQVNLLSYRADVVRPCVQEKDWYQLQQESFGVLGLEGGIVGVA